MNVIMDGVVFQDQSHGGISRIYREILPRMCQMDAKLNVEVFTDGNLRQEIPSHSRIQHRSLFPFYDYLRPRRIWQPIIPLLRNLGRKRAVGRGDGVIWHSTFFSMQEPWHGFRVVTVYDMINEICKDFINDPNNENFISLKKCCIRTADAVICISETTRQDVIRICGVDQDKVSAIPLAASEIFSHRESWVRQPEFNLRKPFLLFIGGRDAYKNFLTFLQGFRIWRRHRDFGIVFVGGSWNRQENQWLKKYGLKDEVELLTGIDDEDLCWLYHHCAAFVYPSHYEGFGIPLLEAFGCGCPVVASRIPVTVEVAGEIPFYFDPQSPEDLSRALDRAINGGRHAARIRAGFECANSYSWDKTAKGTLNVYQQLLQGKKVELSPI